MNWRISFRRDGRRGIAYRSRIGLKSLPAAPRRPGPVPGRRGRAAAQAVPRGLSVMETVLLGAAYPLGLVRAAEEGGSGRRVVQLTDQGRYVLAMGPTPPPKPTFEQFIFVQPNFEVIAYRQGLTPQLVGRLSRFAWWSQIGAALELKLTRESIVLGLDWGMTAEAILEILAKHSQRPLPAGITDAVTNWATRRERVTYYAAATLIEFGSSADRDAALAIWPPSDMTAPIAVAERFLLVEDDKSAPFDRLRLASSRDYRRPPEICAVVEPDGVTLSLDPGRSDLLVEAELARFADLMHPTNTERDHQPSPDAGSFWSRLLRSGEVWPEGSPPPSSPSGTAGAPAARSRPRCGSCFLQKRHASHPESSPHAGTRPAEPRIA